MDNKKSEVIIAANNDWNGFWYQRQQFACDFARLGYRVIYLNKTLQRWPKLKHFIQRIKSSTNRNDIEITVPDGITLLTSLWLPPLKLLRFINRLLIKKTVEKMNLQSKPILITYVPTYNIIDLIDYIKPLKVVYINVHNYNSDDVLQDLIESEIELIKISDFLFADSKYNMKRLMNSSNGKEVFQSLPGVDYDNFRKSKNQEKVQREKTIYYYGGIGSHLDLELYNSLSKRFKVVFIGTVEESIRESISKNIVIKKPVSVKKLPEELFEADILSILYKRTSYVDGVIPAKFFECLATEKPLLVSGLAEVEPYNDIVYNVDGSVEKAINIIKNLEITETELIKNKRNEIAKEADWDNRFNALFKRIME